MRRAYFTKVLGLACGLWLAACKGDDDPADSGGEPDAGPIEFFDALPQDLITPVDILWVIDNGWSEGRTEGLNEDNLNATFETLLLADPSWRMGVLDASATGLAFGLIRTKWETWPYPPNAFQLPNPGPDGPRIRDAVYTALDLRLEQPQNKEFIRSNAHLYIIAFTDEDDDASDEITEDAFAKWLRDFQPSNSKRMSAITVSAEKDYWAEHTVGGIVYSVGSSFERAINTVYRDAIGQKTVFKLSYVPIDPPAVATVVYREHGTEYLIDVDYEYDAEANTIAFNKVVPPPDSEVQVTYMTADEVVPLTTETAPE